MSYFNDHRTQPAPATTVLIGETEHQLPTKWKVCSVCNGEGKHVNPSIDCDGISAEQFHDDPDFHDEYMSGTYDVTCYRCKGRTTEQVVDWDQVPATVRAAYDDEQQLLAQDRAMEAAERRAGA